MRDKEAKNIYPLTKSDLVSRPGGGDVEAALKALETGRGLRPLYELRGAKYNEATGFYELNGLTDITEEQMMAIFAFSLLYGYGGGNVASRCMGYYSNVRTNFPFTGYGISATDLFPFSESHYIEVLTMQSLFDYSRNGISSTLFHVDVIGSVRFLESLKKVKHIYGSIRIRDSFTGTLGKECPLLESTNVKLAGNASFPFFVDSPLLGIGSFRFLIENATNTEAVTLTINGEILAKMQDAEGHPEWHALMQQAAEKQISFATE